MKVQRMLAVRLMADEVAVKADELARELADFEVAEELAKERAAQAKAALKEREDKISKLAMIVRTRREERSVDCFKTADLQRKVWSVFRDDTGELVETEPMTAAEYEKEAQLDFTRAALRSPPVDDDEKDPPPPDAPKKPDGDGAPA